MLRLSSQIAKASKCTSGLMYRATFCRTLASSTPRLQHNNSMEEKIRKVANDTVNKTRDVTERMKNATSDKMKHFMENIENKAESIKESITGEKGNLDEGIDAWKENVEDQADSTERNLKERGMGLKEAYDETRDGFGQQAGSKVTADRDHKSNGDSAVRMAHEGSENTAKAEEMIHNTKDTMKEEVKKTKDAMKDEAVEKKKVSRIMLMR